MRIPYRIEKKVQKMGVLSATGKCYDERIHHYEHAT